MGFKIIDLMNYRYNNPEKDVKVDEPIAYMVASKIENNLDMKPNVVDQIKLWLSMSKEKDLDKIISNAMEKNLQNSAQLTK